MLLTKALVLLLQVSQHLYVCFHTWCACVCVCAWVCVFVCVCGV